MRGNDDRQDGLFSYVSLDARVPGNHPLRAVRTMVDEALSSMSRDFGRLYSGEGRPSIAPERLLRALLLQVFYSIRSERLLIEELDYNLLYRWFVGLSADEPVWERSTFSKNRERLLKGDIAHRLFGRVLCQAKARGLVSDEHFSVDGTLIEAWASQKSFRRKDGSDDDKPDGSGRNAGRNFHGETRSNETHESTTDPQARMYRKSLAQPARLCYAGHVLMENRHGLVVEATVNPASGSSEREAALKMLSRIPGERITLGADKAYDTFGFIEGLRGLKVTPHVAQNLKRRGGSAIDARTTRHPGYAVSQVIRKRIEEAFGWGKTVGPIRKTKFRGAARVGFQFLLTMTGFNLVRMRNLAVATG
ncbi:MAG TPA: IS5 family transposase [Gammaproteobacteria bacterium]